MLISLFHRFTVAIFAVIFLLPKLSAQETNHWETAVMASDIWRYFPGTAEPPANWASRDFSDGTWNEGPGGIGYGDGDDATIIANVPSLYMRIKFNVPDRAVISSSVLHVDFDDGFVAYLNGYEITRANMQAYPYRPAFNDYALLTTYEAKLPAGGVPAMFVINRDFLDQHLVAGENVLALQVHNCNATSSDFSSTTFLSFGINTSDTYFRQVPTWFTDPFIAYSSHLPIVTIDTKGQNINNNERIFAWFKVIDNGPGEVNSFYQSGTDYEGNIGIKVRGQSSQMFPKKSYALELWNDVGADSTVSLLGMPEEEDWILHAHYSDKSMMRNALTFYLGGRTGSWQPRFRYCNVYLNGEYNGIYLLMENIKRGQGRLDISKLNPDEATGDDVTGGYILKVDKTWDLGQWEYFTPYPSIMLPNTRNYNFTYVYPDAEIISSPQKNYIKDYITKLENSLNSDDFRDPTNGFRKYMDISSFVDFQIIQEITNNVDGYRYSTFFYKEKDSKGGRIHAGPLWDFDLCYGNVDYDDYNLSTSGWLYLRYGVYEGNTMHWWARLMDDAGYKRAFVSRWKELRKGAFHTDSVMNFIDSTVAYLDDEVDKNFTRWPILGVDVWPNYFVGQTYEEEVDWFRNWVTQRLYWMDANMPTTDELIDEEEKIGGFIFGPNPATSDIKIMYSNVSIMNCITEIIDQTGRKIDEFIFSPAANGYQEFVINVGHLSRGIYYIRLRQGERILGTKKLVKI